MFNPRDTMFRQEVLEALEIGIRQEITPMMMNRPTSDVNIAMQGAIRGMVLQFSAYFWQNQTTDIVVYTVPDGKWQWFKKRYMVGTRLHRFVEWCQRRFRRWKWYQERLSVLDYKYFTVVERRFEEEVKIVYPYMAAQNVPDHMGRLCIPVMPDGAALGLLPDAEIKQPRVKHVPLWVSQEYALALKKEADRYHVPVEEILCMAISDSPTLSMFRR